MKIMLQECKINFKIANFVENRFLYQIIFYIFKNVGWLKFNVITKFADGQEQDSNLVNMYIII